MRLSDERGAILIHAAMAIMATVLLSAGVIDYGALLVSRNQAQNAADAAALAGAVALGFDSPAGDRWDRARNVAWETGHAHKIWGERPVIIPTSPYDGAPCANMPQRCVRVDVFRNGANGSTAIPTMLASLFGFDNQGVRAMAVAETVPATGTDCLKPWVIPDRYADHNLNGIAEAGEYEKPTINGDGSMNYGSGYSPLHDIGLVLTLTPGNPHNAIAPSDYFEIDDPASGVNGGANYREAIGGCLITKSIGDDVSALPGHRVGPTAAGFDDLLAAHNGGPVIILIALYDPVAFEQIRQTGNFTTHISNLLAFKVDSSSYHADRTITGTIAGAPSDILTACNTPPCSTSSGLVSVIRLRR